MIRHLYQRSFLTGAALPLKLGSSRRIHAEGNLGRWIEAASATGHHSMPQKPQI
jgi:hypothetical protein